MKQSDTFALEVKLLWTNIIGYSEPLAQLRKSKGVRLCPGLIYEMNDLIEIHNIPRFRKVFGPWQQLQQRAAGGSALHTMKRPAATFLSFVGLLHRLTSSIYKTFVCMHSLICSINIS